MSFLIALSLTQVMDPYVSLGGALPLDQWEAAQQYVSQAMRGGPFEGEEASRPPSFISQGSSALTGQRATVRQWESILSGLRQVSDASYPLNSGRDEQGYVKIKNLVKFAAWGAHVRFADGNSHSAVTILLDGLKLSRRLRSGNTLDALVGSACEAIVMASFEEHLAYLSVPECDRVRKVVDGYLAVPLAVPSDSKAAVRGAMEDSPARWVVADADPILPAFAKTLTQLRILRLHLRVETYRWENLKLPAHLFDAAPQEEIDDPLTQEPYQYEWVGKGYRITSKGFKELGPMGLRYRRDPNAPPKIESPTDPKP